MIARHLHNPDKNVGIIADKIIRDAINGSNDRLQRVCINNPVDINAREQRQTGIIVLTGNGISRRCAGQSGIVAATHASRYSRYIRLIKRYTAIPASAGNGVPSVAQCGQLSVRCTLRTVRPKPMPHSSIVLLLCRADQ